MGRLLRLEDGHFRACNANCEGVLQSKRRRDDTYSSGQRWVNTGRNHGLLGASVRICGAYTAYVANERLGGMLRGPRRERERERWWNARRVCTREEDTTTESSWLGALWRIYRRPTGRSPSISHSIRRPRLFPDSRRLDSERERERETCLVLRIDESFRD